MHGQRKARQAATAQRRRTRGHAGQSRVGGISSPLAEPADGPVEEPTRRDRQPGHKIKLVRPEQRIVGPLPVGEEFICDGNDTSRSGIAHNQGAPAGRLLLGVIPESEAVLKASNQGTPVILDEETQAGQAYNDAVDRLLGSELPHRFLEAEKKGFLARLLGGK